MEMTATVSNDLTSACPRGCSGNGECVLGHCQCNPGFDGPDCSLSKFDTFIKLYPFKNSTLRTLQAINRPSFMQTLPGTCPVLCSNNGEYEEGACRCYPGWKGAECSIRHNECEVPDCNNHGNCFNGQCQCSRGYTGQFCEQGKLSGVWKTVINTNLAQFNAGTRAQINQTEF